MSDQTAPDSGGLLADLRATVGARYRSGEYPAGMEAELAAQYERLRAEVSQQSPRIVRFISRLDRASRIDVDKVPFDTRIPLLPFVYRVAGRMIRRHTVHLAGQIEEYAAASRDLMLATLALASGADVAAQWPSPAQNGHRHSASLDEVLEALRGSRATVEAEWEGPVVTLASEQDLEEFLSRDDDASAGVVEVRNLVERVPVQCVVQLLAAARRRLRPAGRLVLESVNPAALYVLAQAANTDASSLTPLPPQLLRLLVEQAGFASSAWEWRGAETAQAPLDYVLTATCR